MFQQGLLAELLIRLDENMAQVGLPTKVENDVLVSTQEVINKALSNLGYKEDVYQPLKEPMWILTVWV